MLVAGKYTGKAIGIRFAKSGKKETPCIEVALRFQDDAGNLHKENWRGWITPDSFKNTLTTLTEVLDYTGDEEAVDVPKGDPREGMLVNQDCINRKKDVQIVLEIEEYANPENGKVYQNPRIKYLNNLGGGQFAGVGVDTVKNTLGALGWKAAYMATKQKLGAKGPANEVQEHADKDVPNFDPSVGQNKLPF